MAIKFFFLFFSIIFCSCEHFFTKVYLTENEKELYGSIHSSLKSFKGIEQAHSTKILIYRNWQYSTPWNDLESWKMSQELFFRVCVEYWKIPVENITVIEHDKGGLLEEYLDKFQGDKLIIYFVSHQSSARQIILHTGQEYPTKRFAEQLNSLKSPTLLIYDTCYADLLKSFLTNSNVSVYYGSSMKEKAYDLRPFGQKISLNEMSENCRKFIKVAWGIDLEGVSPFGFFLVKGILEDSYSGFKLMDLMSSISNSNKKMTKISGLGRYPQVFWEDRAGWGSVVIR